MFRSIYQTRIVNLLTAINSNADFLLINNRSDCFYYSGFNSSNAYILINTTNKISYYITDGRYISEASDIIKHSKIVLIKNGLIETLAQIIKSRKLAVIKNSISYEFFKNLTDRFGNRAIKIIDYPINDLREIKTADELAHIRRGVGVLEKVFENIIEIIKPGISEYDIKIEIEYLMKKLGAYDTAFDTIVLFGNRTSYPHGHPSHYVKLKKNDIILIDCGARYYYYCTDITRMYCIGRIPADFKKLYLLMLELQKQTLLAAVADAKIADLENKIIERLKHEKLDKYYLHATGHGVGIDIHENPRISRNSADYLKAGQVITIEPGVYIPDKFGVRIEDLVYINHTGNIVLTENIDKQIIAL